MNIHTFKDVATSKRSSLANELDEDDDDYEVAPMRREVEGEEEAGQEQFNEMGEAIEPFNLRNEREGGHFDENMNYVFQKERGEVDAWVAEMDEVSMEKAIGEAAAALKRKNDKKEIDEQNAANKVQKSSLQLRRELLSLMQPGETLTNAMRRLGGKDDNKSKSAPNRRRPPTDANSMTDATPTLTAAEIKEKAKLSREAIHRITEIADELMSTAASGHHRGGGGAGALTDIYDMTYEAIQASTQLWEYKGLDNVVYGPFPAHAIAQWKAQGFMTGDTAVLMRACGELQDASSSGANGGGRSQVGAKAKLSSIYDDDELDGSGGTGGTGGTGGAAKKSKVSFAGSDSNTGAQSSSSSSSSTASPAFMPGPWLSSDEIDFGGAFVDLDSNSESVSQSASALDNSSGRTGGASASSATTAKGYGSTASVVRAVMDLDDRGRRRSAGREDIYGGAEGQDEEEEEEEDMGFRRRKSNRKDFGRNDEDEEDD